MDKQSKIRIMLKKTFGLLKTVYEYAVSIVFPPLCCCCGDSVPVGEYICPMCEDMLEDLKIDATRHVKRGGRTHGLTGVYQYSKDNIAAECVKRLKFYGELSCSRYMGLKVGERASRMKQEFDYVTSVPMTVSKEMKRGYNQAEYIADFAAQRLGLKYLRTLKKKFNNYEQHTLCGSDRLRNVSGCYRAIRNVKGKRILLVDDVITTGNTIAEAANTLYEAGADSVTIISFAMVKGGH